MRSSIKTIIALSILSILSACPTTNMSTDVTPSSTAVPTSSVTPTPTESVAPTSVPTVMPTSMPTVTPPMGNNPDISTLPVLNDGYRLSIGGDVYNGAGNKLLNERLESKTDAKGYMRISSFGIEKVGNTKFDYEFRMTIRPKDNFPLPVVFIQSDFDTAELELKVTNKSTNLIYNYASTSLVGRNMTIPSNSLNTSDNSGQISNVVFSSSDKVRYNGMIDTVVALTSNQGTMPNTLRVRLEWNALLPEKLIY